MPRKPNTETRRAEIVAALLPVMARLGYEKATVQAIAKEAGLAPGLIHYHFKNKQEILISLVQSLADYAQARYAAIADEASSPNARLRAYLGGRLGLGEGAAPERVAAWVMIGAEAVRQAEVREVYEQAIQAELSGITDLLRSCLDAHKRDTSPAKEIAAGLMAMMEGAFQLSCAAPGVMPTGYAADAAWRFVMHSIDAAPKLRR
jgi:TetR/AcrR family transcriptional repressor of bet genes